MKKAIWVRVFLLTLLVMAGIITTFIKNKNYIELTEKVNNIWIQQIENVEQIYRQEARNMLAQGKYCINRELEYTTFLEKEKTFDERLFTAIDTCMKKTRTTTTGDSFAFDLKTYNFIYDTSLDCFVSGGKKFYDKVTSLKIMTAIENWDILTKEEQCKAVSSMNKDCTNITKPEFPGCYLHTDVEMCFQAREAMIMGYDSKPGNNISWKFDDAEEWLEWVVLPKEEVGFYNISRGDKSKQPYQVLLALGIQSDEILNANKIDKLFEKVFIQLNSDEKEEKMLIQLMILFIVIFMILTTSIDYYYHKQLECPYQDANCKYKDCK